MVLKKEKVVFRRLGKKPTRFRFRGNIRLGFRRNQVVEITKFKRVKKRKCI